MCACTIDMSTSVDWSVLLEVGNGAEEKGKKKLIPTRRDSFHLLFANREACCSWSAGFVCVLFGGELERERESQHTERAVVELAALLLFSCAQSIYLAIIIVRQGAHNASRCACAFMWVCLCAEVCAPRQRQRQKYISCIKQYKQQTTNSRCTFLQCVCENRCSN